MLCSAAIYTFSAVITFMDGSGEGEWGAQFLGFPVFIVSLVQCG